jgi:hypothetical protein
MRALKAGLVYFTLVFAAGFALGTVRVLFLVPAVGETVAVLTELPVMLTIACRLTISWIACRFVVARLRVPAVLSDRIVMGVFAFALADDRGNRRRLAARQALGFRLSGPLRHVFRRCRPGGATRLRGFPIVAVAFSRQRGR